MASSLENMLAQEIKQPGIRARTAIMVENLLDLLTTHTPMEEIHRIAQSYLDAERQEGRAAGERNAIATHGAFHQIGQLVSRGGELEIRQNRETRSVEVRMREGNANCLHAVSREIDAERLPGQIVEETLGIVAEGLRRFIARGNR